MVETMIKAIVLTNWWLFPVLLLLWLLQLPVVKGMLGELFVNLRLWLFLDKRLYKRLANVTIPVIDGSTQIDHLVVSVFGIFVIETKNMRGWIFGSADQAQWTQKIFKKTSRFQNPLRQNYKHTKAIEALTGTEPEQVHSVVVFTGDASFKTPMPSNVLYVDRLIRYIKAFKQPVFTEEEVERLLEMILSQRLAATRQTHKAHVANLQARNDVNAARLCPRCGESLVVREVRSGPHAGEKFWGCSAYPKCRTVQKIMSDVR